MNNEHTITRDDLDFLIKDNSIIPTERKSILQEGLYLGLSGNLYASLHILLPQTEHIFRKLCFCMKAGYNKLKKTKTKRFPSRKPLLDLAPCAGFDTIDGMYMKTGTRMSHLKQTEV